jgi:hypothetical protein
VVGVARAERDAVSAIDVAISNFDLTIRPKVDIRYVGDVESAPGQASLRVRCAQVGRKW